MGDPPSPFPPPSPFSPARVRSAYDVVADDYHAAFGSDLGRLPLDRRMLDLLGQAAGTGAVLDLGCGTGSAGGYLAGLGVRVVGLDLSAGMLAACRSAHGLPPCQGDMRHLPFADGTFAAVAAYYSVHHVARAELGAVLTEVARVLVPGGRLLVATHLGAGEVHADTFLGHAIDPIAGTLSSRQEITDRLVAAGFSVLMSETRAPLANELSTERVYLLAQRRD